MTRLSADESLARFGPSTGDRIRLGDTDLWVRVAEDRQAPGDEPIWGYAKNLRSGMAQRERGGRRQAVRPLALGCDAAEIASTGTAVGLGVGVEDLRPGPGHG